MSDITKVKIVTYDDKVRKGSPEAVKGTTDTFRAVDANELKAAVNNNAEMTQHSFDTVNDLYIQINPFTQTLTGSLAKVQEIVANGVYLQNNLSWTNTVNGKGVQVDTLRLARGTTVLSTNVNARAFSDSFPGLTSPGTVTWSLATTYSGQGQQSAENTYAVQFVAPSFYGNVSALAMTAAIAKGLQKDIRNIRGKTISGISFSANRFAYVYPTAFGALSSIKDQNNFEYINSFTRTTLVIDGIEYYSYVLTNPTTASNIKYIFA